MTRPDSRGSAAQRAADVLRRRILAWLAQADEPPQTTRSPRVAEESAADDASVVTPVPARQLQEPEELRRFRRIWTVMTFLQGTRTHDATLISVIMPTRNRAAYLPDALASVFAQRHQNFELIVIDDGSSDGTPALLAEMNDPRLRVLHTDGVGSSLARNLALDAATGESIVYLDDDNLMDPGWLQAVAWAFDRWPACQVLYGARVLEDHQSASGVPSGEMPSFEWEPFDRRRLEVGNFIDMNVLSHRAGLPEARFDETLESCSDWVLALDLTARHEPLELPAIACVYRAYAPNRLCNSASYLDTHHRVLARVEEAARATTAAPAPACAPAPQPATA